MRITTKLVVDFETGRILEHRWYEYSGPVALCKHEEEKKLATTQTNFYNELIKMQKAQFGEQSSIFKFLQNTLKPLIEHPTGFSAVEEAALRTQATETTTGQFENAARNFQERSFILGGRELPSGALLAGLGGLEGMRASEEAGGQRQISLQNEALRRQNFWNAASMLGGVASGYNPVGFAGAATGAGSAAQVTTAAAYEPFWQKVLGGAIVGFAGGAGNALLGGMGGGGSNLVPWGAGATSPGTSGNPYEISGPPFKWS